MLLPGFLGHIADKAVELWEQLNLFAIRDICRRIADAGNHMTASAEWQIYKMEQSGMSRDAIMRAVSRVMKLSDEEVRRIFEEAAIESHNNDADVFTEAGVQPEPFGTEQAGKSMQVYYEQTNNELRNYTRTTALQSQQIFINACDGAFLAVQSGLKSSAEAIRDAIDDAARDGLYVYYPSGHRDTVEVAVRRAVMTGVNRAALQMTVDECERNGTNFVIVSSHLGARVSDTNPIADHAGWQGKIYRLSDEKESFWGKLRRFIPFLRGRKYPLLRDATGYPDDPLGLGGYNCRHSMYPYIPGVTENHMKQFDPEKNRKAFEDSQRQRAMEREIRKKKRQVEGLKAAAEASEGEQLEAIEELLKKRKKELADLTAKYRQFCKDNGLSENLERTYIAHVRETIQTERKGSKKRYTKIQDKSIIDLTDEELAAVNEYKGGRSYTLNEKLRAPGGIENLNDEEKRLVAVLDGALGKLPRYKGNLVRTLDFHDESSLEEFINQIHQEDIKTAQQFISTTTMEDYNPDGQVLIRIIGAQNGRDFRMFNPEEEEIIYERSQRFLIKKVFLNKGRYYILAEEYNE